MSAQQVDEGYAVPTEMKVWSAKIGEQDVVVVDLTVIVPGVDLDEQRALLVFTTEDATDLAASINLAAAGEEQ